MSQMLLEVGPQLSGMDAPAKANQLANLSNHFGLRQWFTLEDHVFSCWSCRTARKSKSAKTKRVVYKLALLENVESDHCLEFTCKSIIAAASICSFDLAPFSLDLDDFVCVLLAYLMKNFNCSFLFVFFLSVLIFFVKKTLVTFSGDDFVLSLGQIAAASVGSASRALWLVA